MTYQIDQRHYLLTRTHNITFWLPVGLLAFRTEKKPSQIKQINVLTGPSLWTWVPALSCLFHSCPMRERRKRKPWQEAIDQ